MPEWCTGIPVLVHWVAIAMFRMAAVGFAFAFAFANPTPPLATVLLTFFTE